MTLSRRTFIRGLLGLVAAASIPVGVAFAARKQSFEGILDRPQYKGLPTISTRRFNKGATWDEGLALKDRRYAMRIQSVQSYMGVDYAHRGADETVFYVPRRLLEEMADA